MEQNQKKSTPTHCRSIYSIAKFNTSVDSIQEWIFFILFLYFLRTREITFAESLHTTGILHLLLKRKHIHSHKKFCFRKTHFVYLSTGQMFLASARLVQNLLVQKSCVPSPTHFQSWSLMLLSSASCSEPMWDFLPSPSHLSERASWTSPHATWIILWVFCCARPSALWTCLPAWRPSTCHCGRASRAPCSSLASWCTCSTGSTRPGYPWDLCPRQRCTIPCGSCTDPLYNKVREKWERGSAQ